MSIIEEVSVIKKKGLLKKLIIGIMIFLLAITGAFIVWAKNTYSSKEVVSSNNLVDVEREKYIVIKPKGKEPSRGFIFYPGAKVEPDAYSKLCSEIAEEGYFVVIPKMTLNFAIFSSDEANDIINKYSNIKNWTIGGHSLGGVSAANYAVKDDRIDSIIFYASYPQADTLKGSKLKSLSIYGSTDGVANLSRVEGAVLPEESEEVVIEGGNHAGFGTYGEQSGDNEADISNEDQIKEAVKYTVEFLNNL